MNAARRRVDPRLRPPIAGASALALAMAAGGLAEGRAQVVLDGKFGTSGALTGPNYAIPASVGSTHGNNLFHSFAQFDLAAGAVARFSGPANIQNILARVTGATPSSINGTIRSDISGANLYLINPHGILFGPSASINVSGSFAASSASYLKLADGARFVASLDADDSTLSTAPVGAFGFLGSTPGPLTLDHTTLRAARGKSLSLVGGDVSLTGSTVQAAVGEVRLASVRSAGELPADPSSLNLAAFQAAFPAAGSVTVQGSSLVDASGSGGGRVVIRGGQLTVEGSRVQANTTAAGNGLGIDVAVSGNLDILNGGQINSLSTTGQGASGSITLAAGGAVRLDGGGSTDPITHFPDTQIATGTGDEGSGGGPGAAGHITIHAASLSLADSAQISSASFGAGNAGNIDITAPSISLDARMDTYAQITANTHLTFGGGNAGNITIHATTFEMKNAATLLAATFGSGHAGAIELTADRVNLTSFAVITAATFGSGLGGNIQVTADTVHVDGRDTFGGGPDGLTGIQAVTTSLDDPAPGGTVSVNARSVSLEHMGSFFTTTYGIGPGGNVEVHADQLSLDTGASLKASTELGATGPAGTISVHAARDVVLSGGSAITTSALNSSGGNIQVTAGSSIRVNQSQISAQAGPGGGGNITLSAPSLIYLNDSLLTAQAQGDGGNLTIDPVFFILNDSGLISMSSSANGGNITLLSDFFFQSGSTIDASAPFGIPGTVSVFAPEIDLSGSLVGLPGNVLDAEDRLGAHCGIRLAGNISSLVVLGRGGLPVAPGGFIPSAPPSLPAHEAR